MKKNVVIIGAGPAGLSAGFEILKNTDKYNVIILEKTDAIGGISRTVCHNGNRMDIGGHRFFSKDDEIVKWWFDILPVQNKQSIDDILLNEKKILPDKGSDPETENLVMLKRKRVSRILYNGKFFDYPIKMNFQTIKKLGIKEMFYAGVSYINSLLFKKNENSLEDFYINRFGKKLYSMFFENYTEKLWGRHPKDISPDWGRQRVKGLSITGIIKDIFFKLLPFIKHNVETSLIEEFLYPKFGPGQLWEEVAKIIQECGGKLYFNSEVTKIELQDDKITKLTYKNSEQKELDIIPDCVISSMPLKDLILAINTSPKNIRDYAVSLPYRDFVTIGILVNNINLVNETKIKTYNKRIPDCWMYIQDSSVKLGRIQIFNNWSPYLIKDYKNTLWLGLEYFCKENDDFWNMSKNEALDYAACELIKMKIINSKNDIIDFHREKVEKAYPAYFDSYKNIDEIITYLNSIDNLFCIGRNGQHRYNNMDHSMKTGFLAAECIIKNKKCKDEVWNVNIEKTYHETK